MEEERNALFSEVREFSAGKLKKVEQSNAPATATVDNAALKLDLQVGLVVPGLLIGKLRNSATASNSDTSTTAGSNIAMHT